MAGATLLRAFARHGAGKRERWAPMALALPTSGIAHIALALLLALPSLLFAQQPENSLLRDVMQGNAAGVRYWLSQGVDPNLRTLPTLLMTAAEGGHTEIAGMLVDAGAKLETKD